MDNVEKIFSLLNAIKAEIKEIKGETTGVWQSPYQQDNRLDNILQQVVDNNLALVELNILVRKLTEGIENLANHEARIIKLEQYVYKQG